MKYISLRLTIIAFILGACSTENGQDSSDNQAIYANAKIEIMSDIEKMNDNYTFELINYQTPSTGGVLVIDVKNGNVNKQALYSLDRQQIYWEETGTKIGLNTQNTAVDIDSVFAKCESYLALPLTDKVITTVTYNKADGLTCGYTKTELCFENCNESLQLKVLD
tara:strand:+ start:2502 stop:2996 length:495 start_codon:yes stop_codon:yes gene_type:complete